MTKCSKLLSTDMKKQLTECLYLMLQTTLPDFEKQEFSVVRQHEEFVWLHDRFEENEEYAGFIVSLEFRHHK
jgi:hypothetical protein